MLTSSKTVTERTPREGGTANSFIVQCSLWRWWCQVFPVGLLLTAAGNQRRTNLTVTTETESESLGFMGNVVF